MNLENICNEVCLLSENVGNFIREQRARMTPELVETKSVNSLVTYVDKEAERQLVVRLQQLIPESGFITEEETISKTGEVYNWIIDPLDGTTNFIHGVPLFCISIALTRNGQLVLGVIYEVNLKECFYAWEGSPAYLNKKEITVSKTALLKDSLLATGFPYYDYDQMAAYLELFQYLMKNTRGLRRLGSAAVDLAYVACGRFDAFYEYSLNSWDVAAGAFIVQQAGGTVTDFSGGDNYIFGKEMIATNGFIHSELEDAVDEYF